MNYQSILTVAFAVAMQKKTHTDLFETKYVANTFAEFLKERSLNAFSLRGLALELLKIRLITTFTSVDLQSW